MLVVVTDETDSDYVIRRAAPIECERLFGLPDNWTNVGIYGKPGSDTFRYKAPGNSIVCPCPEFIGERLWWEHCRASGIAEVDMVLAV